MNLKKFSVGSAALVFLSFSANASIPTGAKISQTNHLGHVKVGDSIRNLPSIYQEINRFRMAGKKFHHSFVFVRSDLPKNCMNLQCGRFAKQIISNGGLLVGGAEQGLSTEVGSDPKTAVLLVADSQDRVTAIYKDASAEDFRAVLASIKDKF